MTLILRVEVDLDIYDQDFMTTNNINKSFDFNEVPWGTKEIFNRITYIRDMKSTIGGVITNFWQPARELYFGLFIHGIVTYFWL